MTSHSGHDIKPTVPTVFVVWILLMVLLVITYLVGVKLDIGEWNFAIAFAIALVKATLIILFFMGVKYSQPLVRLIAGSGFFFMFIMLVFTFCDFKTRNHIPGIAQENPAPLEAASEEPQPH